MSVLHTVNKSPYSHSTLESCLQVCSANDSILLLEDGVFAVIEGSPCHTEMCKLIKSGVTIYALNIDINARGLQKKVHPEIQLTDYNGFVELSIKHRCVQSWY
jgi:tRNA 2-thiouridine synthesizing protein B